VTGRWRALPLLAALWVSLAGCVSVPQETDGRETRAPTEPADPERRARVRLELASAYFERGQAKTALDEVNVALQAKPDLPEAYNLRGLVYASLGDAPNAEADFRRALQLKPNDADTMHNYGWLLCQQRRYADADAQFNAALAQPQYRGSARTLLAQGVCQARAGAWPAAERSLTRSYELDASNPATAFNLADVLYRRGEYTRARFYIQRVNSVREQSNAQSLWLALRIEYRLGNEAAVRDLSRQLRDRFPQSPEVSRLERGAYDE
jgi:type IV pilus assembly protein PilF